METDAEETVGTGEDGADGDWGCGYYAWGCYGAFGGLFGSYTRLCDEPWDLIGEPFAGYSAELSTDASSSSTVFSTTASL